MTEIYVYYFIFLIVFTMHEFEEVLFLTKWTKKNGDLFKNKIRKKPINNIVEAMNEIKFGLIVLEEYILLLSLLIYIVLTDKNIIFLGIVLGYTFHIIAHIVQSLQLKKYVPGLGTGIMSGGVSIFIALKVINLYGYNFFEIVKATALISIGIVINLLICYLVAHVLIREEW
ncbi:HXXEE domain-containing protein [Clostridium paraputrificum]|uniref:HXXEE domain-containing protein n=1 Tax=Clostridium paraputrificum TaxID=29363 RepID=UPI003D34AE6D